jgi:hypothetical protein
MSAWYMLHVPMPPVISELELTRFRGLRHVALRELGRINLVVGENNSGKTSVLEALALATNPLEPWNWMDVAGRREPSRSRSRTTAERIRWLFPQHASEGPGTPYDGSIEISTSGNTSSRRLTAQYVEMRGAPEQATLPLARQASTSSDDLPDRDDEDVVPERWGCRVEVASDDRAGQVARSAFTWWDGESFEGPRPGSPVMPCQIVTPYDHLFRAIPARRYSDARRSGPTATVVDLLSAIDPRITGIEVLAARGPVPFKSAEAVLYLRDQRAGLLPVEAFGDGMRRILVLALAISAARGGVLLIDEIETAVHVSALGRVFRWVVEACTEHDVQMFATTHSLEAIDAILAADTTPAHDIVGFRLGAQGDHTQRYGEPLLRRLRFERGADVR